MRSSAPPSPTVLNSRSRSAAASSADARSEYFTVDDEAEPAKAPENTNKLVQRDKVDVLVGTVHSGVQMGMVKIAKENQYTA